VVDATSLRLIIFLAVQMDLEIHQMDVETAYLYGALTEEIYLQVPEGITYREDIRKPGVRLQRALYGLKQSGICWYLTLTTFLTKQGCQNISLKVCIMWRIKQNQLVIIVIYIDDLLILGNQ